MKILLRNPIHESSKSYDMLIGNISGQKVKFSYVSRNATEECTVQFFDGQKLNTIFDMYDLGVVPDSSSYVWDTNKRKKRADELFDKAKKLCELLLK